MRLAASSGSESCLLLLPRSALFASGHLPSENLICMSASLLSLPLARVAPKAGIPGAAAFLSSQWAPCQACRLQLPWNYLLWGWPWCSGCWSPLLGDKGPPENLFIFSSFDTSGHTGSAQVSLCCS